MSLVSPILEGRFFTSVPLGKPLLQISSFISLKILEVPVLFDGFFWPLSRLSTIIFTLLTSHFSLVSWCCSVNSWSSDENVNGRKGSKQPFLLSLPHLTVSLRDPPCISGQDHALFQDGLWSVWSAHAIRSPSHNKVLASPDISLWSLLSPCLCCLHSCMNVLRGRWEHILNGNPFLPPSESSQSVVLSNTCCCSVAKSCPTLCNPIDCSTPGSSILHYLPEFAQAHVHRVWWCQPNISSSAIPFSPSQSFPASDLFQWLGSLHLGPKYWDFSLSISPSNEFSGLISFSCPQTRPNCILSSLKHPCDFHVHCSNPSTSLSFLVESQGRMSGK